jgi:hypothetical protein
VRAAHKEEEILEKFHLDRVSNKSEIGVSIEEEIINHQMIFQIDFAENKFQLEQRPLY